MRKRLSNDAATISLALSLKIGIVFLQPHLIPSTSVVMLSRSLKVLAALALKVLGSHDRLYASAHERLHRLRSNLLGPADLCMRPNSNIWTLAVREHFRLHEGVPKSYGYN